MTVAEAQREMRAVYLNGAIGQAVAGTIWLTSSAASTFGSVRAGILILVVGGMFIFPATQAILLVTGRRTSVSSENPLNALAMQVAFTVPLLLPLAGAAALYRLEWFYPAVMVVVGAHYLPFMTLYGMRSFGVLAGALLAGGFALAFRMPPGLADTAGAFTAGGWLTAFTLLAFAGHARSFSAENAEPAAAAQAATR